MHTRRPEQSFVRAGAVARASGGLRVSGLALGVAATLVLSIAGDWMTPGVARADAAATPTSTTTTTTTAAAAKTTTTATSPANTTTAKKPAVAAASAHPTTSAKSPAAAQMPLTTVTAAKPAAAPAKTNTVAASNASTIPPANPTAVHPARPATAQTAAAVKPAPAPVKTTALAKPAPAPATAQHAKPSASPAGANPANASARVASTHPSVVTVSSTPMVAGTTPQSKLNVPGTHLEDRIAYQYNALGRRDPFQPLVDGGFVGNDVGGDAPPDVGGIKVVGIVWGTNDKFALVEDPRGNSLVLRPGDKVMNGVVTGLKRDAVMVTMTVDGQTESVAIPLTRKGEN